jgi:hypothetical protein
MEKQILIDHAVDLIMSWAAVLDQKGVPYALPDVEELRAMDVFEVRRILKEMRDLARTPT